MAGELLTIVRISAFSSIGRIPLQSKFGSPSENLEGFPADQKQKKHIMKNRMGSPQRPTAEQYSRLEQAGQWAAFTPPERIHVANGRATVNFSLPRQAISLLVLDW
jgi:hypothetical protein